jgi:hypothetical protein
MYYADNESGFKLTLIFQDDDVMMVSINAPIEDENTATDNANTEAPQDEGSTTNEPEPTGDSKGSTPPSSSSEKSDGDSNKTDTEKPQPGTGIDPDFKAAMDSYEAFFDEYVAFMKKYESSTDTVAMLNDFTTYMTRYSEMMAKMDAIDEDSLNTAELAYYTEVQTRILNKLTEVS